MTKRFARAFVDAHCPAAMVLLIAASAIACASNADSSEVRNPRDLVREDRLVRNTQEMVRINSEFSKGTVHNHREIAAYLATELDAMGVENHLLFAAEPFSAPYHRDLGVPYPGDPRDFPVVVARIRGTKGTPVLGMTQMFSTVVIGDRSQWTVDPLGGEIIDGRIYGRGATNSKASVATYLEALRVLKESGMELSGDFIVVFPPGEGGTEFGMPYVVEHHRDLVAADWYLVSCCGPNFTKQGGHIWAKVTVHGAMHHPIAGAHPNAVHQMAEVIPAIADVERWMTWKPDPLFGDRTPYVEVTHVSSGDSEYVAVNVMPSKVEALLDMRLFPNQEPEQVVAELKGLLEELMEADPELAVDLEVTGIQKPPEEVWDRVTDDDPLIKEIVALSREYLDDPNIQPRWGGSFAGGRPDFWNLGAKVVYSGGLRLPGGGGGAHAPDEWVSIDGLVPRTQIIVDVAMRVLKNGLEPNDR